MRDVGYGWCMQVVDVCLVGYALEDVEREREQETGTVQILIPYRWPEEIQEV
jgi:hypothetical protein